MAAKLSGSSAIQLEIELMDAGKRLFLLPSSCSELLDALAHMEQILSGVQVQQLPPESMKYTMHPIIEALIAKELVKHPDIDVNILVASCICEILRIMAPNLPYNDQMKEFFELATMTFKKLSSECGGCFTRLTKVLKTFSSFKLPVLMLDLQLDKLVVQLFKQFLKAADSNCCDVVLEMERIMTMMIEKSEKFKIELLGLLVMSVRKDNQSASPVCWRLGEKVLKNCAGQLKPYLPDIVHDMGIPLQYYSKIVAHICNGVLENEALVPLRKKDGPFETETESLTNTNGFTPIALKHTLPTTITSRKKQRQVNNSPPPPPPPPHPQRFVHPPPSVAEPPSTGEPSTPHQTSAHYASLRRRIRSLRSDFDAHRREVTVELRGLTQTVALIASHLGVSPVLEQYGLESNENIFTLLKAWEILRNSTKWASVPETNTQTGRSKQSKTSESNEYTQTSDARCPIDLNDEIEPKECRPPIGKDKGKRVASSTKGNILGTNLELLAQKMDEHLAVQKEKVALRKEQQRLQDFQILKLKTDDLEGEDLEAALALKKTVREKYL